MLFNTKCVLRIVTDRNLLFSGEAAEVGVLGGGGKIVTIGGVI